MGRSRSRSKSRDRKRNRSRSRSRDRRANRSRSRERRRGDDRRVAPEGGRRQSPSGGRRQRSPDGRREPRLDSSRRDRSRERMPPPSATDSGHRPRGGSRERMPQPPTRASGHQRQRDGSQERPPLPRDSSQERRAPLGDSGYRPPGDSRDRQQRGGMPAPEWRGPGACFTCGEEGHLARDCPSAPPGGGGGGGRGACFNCGQEGHIARDCPNPEAPGARPGGGGGRRRRGGGGDEGDSNTAWGKPGEQDEDEAPDVEAEPEFGLSGALAAETNKVNGVVLVHQEPPEARKPTIRWRLYVFKNGKPLGDPLFIHRSTSYLFGRERRVVDVPTDHPSCSKQHAVLQYRFTDKEGADGMMKGAVRPYIMDLGSTNGTFLNGERIEAERYYELLEQDLLRFGNSSREYVLLKEK